MTVVDEPLPLEVAPLPLDLLRVTGSARYRFNQWASVYLVGAVLTQGDAAHYCLGPSGHGYALCGRDAQNDVIGGATLSSVSTGLTFDF